MGCRIFCGKHITTVRVGFKHFLPFLFLFSSKEYWDKLFVFFSAFQRVTIGVKSYKTILKENFDDLRSLPLPACPLVLSFPKPSHI